MKLQFTGDFKKLQKFAKQVSKAPETLTTVSEQLAEETIELIRLGFERSTDPYGDRWAALALRNGRPLEDTGGLKASWKRSSAGRRGFKVSSSKQYAVYHQGGTGLYGPRKRRIRALKAKALKLPGGIYRKSVKGSPRRRMVPESRRLPAFWVARYVETSHEVLTALFNG